MEHQRVFAGDKTKALDICIPQEFCHKRYNRDLDHLLLLEHYFPDADLVEHKLIHFGHLELNEMLDELTNIDLMAEVDKVQLMNMILNAHQLIQLGYSNLGWGRYRIRTGVLL